MLQGEEVEVQAIHDDWSIWFQARVVRSGGEVGEVQGPIPDAPEQMKLPRLVHGGHRFVKIYFKSSHALQIRSF